MSGSDCSATTSLPVLVRQQLFTQNLRLLRRYWSDWQKWLCEKQFQSYLLRAQKCIDHFLLSVPRENGVVARKTGCPLSPNLIHINSAARSHFPPGLSLLVEYHFISDPNPRNDQRPAGNLFANRDTSVELSTHSVSLSLFHHMMSLNIDMKIIRP